MRFGAAGDQHFIRATERLWYAVYAARILVTFTNPIAVGILDTMVVKPEIERVITPMDRKLVERIDDFRYARRIPSRAEAIRQLIEAGLRQAKKPAPRS